MAYPRQALQAVDRDVPLSTRAHAARVEDGHAVLFQHDPVPDVEGVVADSHVAEPRTELDIAAVRALLPEVAETVTLHWVVVFGIRDVCISVFPEPVFRV